MERSHVHAASSAVWDYTARLAQAVHPDRIRLQWDDINANAQAQPMHKKIPTSNLQTVTVSFRDAAMTCQTMLSSRISEQKSCPLAELDSDRYVHRIESMPY